MFAPSKLWKTSSGCFFIRFILHASLSSFPVFGAAAKSLNYSTLHSIIATVATPDGTRDGNNDFAGLQYFTLSHDPSEISASTESYIENQWIVNSKTNPTQTAPYLVCDETVPLSGIRRAARVRNACGIKKIPKDVIHNGMERTCFLISLNYRSALACSEDKDGAENNVTATPYTPWMKVPSDTIVNRYGVDEGARDYFSSFCSNVASPAEVRSNIWKSMEDSFASSALCQRDLTEIKFPENSPLKHYLDLIVDIERGGLIVKILNFNHAIDNQCILEQLEVIASSPKICSLELDHKLQTLNDESRWIIQGAVMGSSGRLLPFYDVGIMGQGQVVQISDTGVSINSCYFYDKRGEVRRDRSKSVNARRKVVQYYAKSDGVDSQGHGTHCAGTAIGEICPYVNGCSPNPQSSPSFDGVAPKGKVAVYDIHSVSSPYLSPGYSDEMFGVGLVANAYVHSASWGAVGNTYNHRDKDFDQFLYKNDRYLLVIAGGNYGSGDNPGSVLNVGKNVVTVCASENSSYSINYVSEFSGRGPSYDNRIKPDICAPGRSIKSAAHSGYSNSRNCSSKVMSGTSMATPGVAGAALLIRQYFMEGWYPSGTKVEADRFTPSGALIKAVLVNSGQALVGVQKKYGGPTSSVPYDHHQGFGRISLIDSLYLHGRPETRNRIYIKDRLRLSSTSKPFEVTFRLDQCSAPYFSATLVYTDKENSSISCRTCLINRLDLTVSQNGNVHFPNGKGAPDEKNNVQRVRLKYSPNDIVRVKVAVVNFATNMQAVSLVISGCITSITNQPTNFQNSNSPVKSIMPSKKPSYVLSEFVTYFGFPTVMPSKSEKFNSLGELKTSFEKNEFWYAGHGNMFNIRAKKDIKLINIGVHYVYDHLKSLEVWVYKGRWTEAQSDASAWNLLGSRDIRGRGKEQITSLQNPPWLELNIAAGEVYGIYIRFSDHASGLLSPPSKNEQGAIYAQNNDIAVETGAMVNDYFYGHDDQGPCEWQGMLQYRVYRTKNRSHSKVPSNNPSKLLTTDPSKSPTQSPASPSKVPSNNPSKLLPCVDDPNYRWNNRPKNRFRCKKIKKRCKRRDKFGRLVKEICTKTCLHRCRKKSS